MTKLKKAVAFFGKLLPIAKTLTVILRLIMEVWDHFK